MPESTAFVCVALTVVAVSSLLLGGCEAPLPDDGNDGNTNGVTDDPRAEVGEARVDVIDSDSTGLQVAMAFGLPTMEVVEEGGESWTRLRIAGLDSAGEGDGCPEVPVYRCLLAVPQGAEVELARVTPVPVDERQLHLYPFQALGGEFSTDVDRYTDELPPPAVFTTPPFRKDADAYGQDRLYPSEPCRVERLGAARDLDIAMLECASGQYNPVTGKMTFFASIDAQVAFSGGSGRFLSDRMANPFDNGASVAMRAVVNRDVIGDHLAPDLSHVTRVGEELLILTHPDYRGPADQLAAWKQGLGILTRVVEVNDGDGPGPDTKEGIDALIDDHYNHGGVRPSYILLFGDHDDIPTWFMQRLIKDPGVMLATDFPYAQINTSTDPYHLDFLPDAALGRIPVDTPVEAQTVVDKIIAYESAPPELSSGTSIFDLYTEATVAGSFECCWEEAPYDGWGYNYFIYNAELVRTQLMAHNYTVQRIYNTFTSHHPDYQGDPTPRYFTSGDPLPYELSPANGFPWDGNTPELIDAFNEGRMLFFYFDHGGSTGWSLPRLTNHSPNNLPSLTNANALPVVFCMNCSSGAIDTDYGFAKDLLRLPGGGAIGVFAFTRMANAGLVEPVTMGALDALWPDVLPEFGDTNMKHRLGDIFNHAKGNLAAHAGSDPSSNWYLNTLNHERLLQLTGDPTLSVWTASPNDLPGYLELIPERDYLELRYPIDGAIITAIENTADGPVPIGRGVVRDGRVQLMFVTEPEDLARVRFSAAQENAVGRALTLTNQPTADIIEPLAGADFTEGEAIVFRGESADRFGRLLPDSSAEWWSSIDGLLGTGHEIETELSEGTHEVTFQVTEAEDLVATDIVTITVNPAPSNSAPVASIDDPASDVLHYVPGGGSLEVTLMGSASDEEDGSLSGDSLVWKQSTDGGAEMVVGHGRTLTVTLYVPGGLFCAQVVYEFTLIATDSDGRSRQAVRTITLNSCSSGS